MYLIPGTYYAVRSDDSSDPDIVFHSQDFITPRAPIFIEPDNPAIGLMRFIGESTYWLDFRPETRLKPLSNVIPGALRKVNSNIFFIDN